MSVTQRRGMTGSFTRSQTPAASLDFLPLGRAYRPDELETIGEPA